MEHARRAHLRHAQQFLHRLREIERQSGAPHIMTKEQQDVFVGLWPQVRHALAWVISHGPDDIDADRLCAEYPMSAPVYWFFRVAPHERVEILQAALAAARRLGWLGRVAALGGNLGMAYLHAGNPSKAVGRFDEALEINNAHDNRVNEAYDHGGLGLAYLRTRLV